MKTEKNIGTLDRIIRIVVAIIAAYLGIKVSPWFFIITAAGLVTAALGWCGLYPLLKINTAKK